LLSSHKIVEASPSCGNKIQFISLISAAHQAATDAVILSVHGRRRAPVVAYARNQPKEAFTLNPRFASTA